MSLPGEHILAGFTLGFRHRHDLARLLAETRSSCSILALDPAVLKEQGVDVLALDFDGVLSPHGFSAPLPEARAWLSSCADFFGTANIFILSNKPTEERRLWFSKYFPEIRFISGVRKKPFPDGLKKIGELAQVPLSAVLMVDDRLLTGCLAAIHAGARPAYIRNPFVSFRNRPFAELFFVLLRAVERMVVRLIA